MGLIMAPDAIESADITLVPTGQIVYDLNRREALRVVNGFLDSRACSASAGTPSGSTS